MEEFKKILLSAIVLAVFAISVIILSGHTEWVFAATGNVTVIVNISEVAQLSVRPTSLTWNSSTPGTDAGNQTIEVKNTGSLNLTNIWASVNITDKEVANPLGQDSTYYASGGMIAMANDTNFTFFFVGRLEWNISYIPSGWNPPARQGAANRSWGWFRNTSSEYLWELQGNETTATCNNTGTYLNISTTADAGAGAGTRSPTASGWDSTATGFTQGADWGVGKFTTGPLAGYCVAAWETCEKIFIYRYDQGSQWPSCTDIRYLKTAKLTPGSVAVYNVRAWIPYGMPRGNTTASTLTISAT